MCRACGTLVARSPSTDTQSVCQFSLRPCGDSLRRRQPLADANPPSATGPNMVGHCPGAAAPGAGRRWTGTRRSSRSHIGRLAASRTRANGCRVGAVTPGGRHLASSVDTSCRNAGVCPAHRLTRSGSDRRDTRSGEADAKVLVRDPQLPAALTPTHTPVGGTLDTQYPREPAGQSHQPANPPAPRARTKALPTTRDRDMYLYRGGRHAPVTSGGAKRRHVGSYGQACGGVKNRSGPTPRERGQAIEDGIKPSQTITKRCMRNR
jgi:hypothetical protein